MYDVQRLADADNVDIEVAIADTPFYPAVGEDSMGTELRAWAPDTLSTSLRIESRPAYGQRHRRTCHRGRCSALGVPIPADVT